MVRLFCVFVLGFSMGICSDICGVHNLDIQSEQPSYVTCAIGSQLGNQLFEISTALTTAWENDALPVFPELNKTELNIPLNREKIFFRLSTDDPQGVSWNRFTLFGLAEHDKLVYQPIPYQPNLYISGWHFMTDYFNHYKEKLIEIYSPSEEEELAIVQQYNDLIMNNKTVAVHIRVYNPHYFHFLGLEYFKEAMELFPEDSTFVIFSCRPGWVKEHLSGYKPNMVFISGNDHVRDFFLINKCKHHIISNSTYSFWAAYLKNDPEQIVIAPDLYIPGFERFSTDNGAYPSHWKVLHVEVDRDYPSDIIEFTSSSIDGG